ncbi:beta-ketoacyl-[acyl-carrier-protein] synthase III [Flavobacteriaceae bacterium UJ101]|nr:beta-ketoacyl-[acyl-carrier-protein] synthase III [Flavobacteriaceae bacterium UJ101]
MKAAITAIGGYVPEDILSNTDLEKIVETNDEWIRTRTGIEERRILKDPAKPTSYMAIKAVQEIIEKKKVDPKTIDAVILGTITSDYGVAATAAHVATQIGAVNAFAYDLVAACSGFVYSYSMGTSLIQSGRYRKVLVVCADKMSSIVNYEDRNTCIIFGDGAGAVLLEPGEEFGFESEILRSDGDGADFLKSEYGGSMNPITVEAVENRLHYFKQEGRQVFKNAVSRMSEVFNELLKKNNLTAEDIDWVLPHQANKRIIEAVANHGSIPMEKVLVNIQRYGNTTNATIPLLLWDFESKFKKGDKIIFVTFGGGFTWGATLLTWSY